MTPNSATVVITTRNRCTDVLRAVDSAVKQSFAPLEVLVYDDASDDGTAEAVRREFPSVRVIRSEQRVGYIVLRNRGFKEAQGEVVFSLDDDAYFTCPETIARTMELFAQSHQIAAIALPYVEPSTDRGRTMPVIPADRKLRSYVGCAHAVRRPLALELGGYREFFVHQGEERDLCLRLIDRGYEIILGDTPPIVHDYSPRRDRWRLSYYGVRNTLLFDALNLPFRELLIRLPADAFNLLRYKLTFGSLLERIGFVTAGLGACLRFWSHRKPVSAEAYRRFRALPRHGPLPSSDSLEASLATESANLSVEAVI